MQADVILEDLHDDPTAYEMQLRALRFDATLEAAYQHQAEANCARASFAFVAVITVVWCGFVVMDIVRIQHLADRNLDWLVGLWLSARWIALVFLVAVLVVTRRFSRPYARLTWWAYLVVGVAIAVTSNIAHYKGAFVADSSQVIVIMCGFLPFGLVYRRAVVAVLAIAGFSLFALAIGAGTHEPLHQAQLALMIVVATAAALVGAYFREMAERRQFLLALLLEKRASTDVLTGLPNRRRFLEHLDTVLRHASRENVRIGLALADIDFFKQYNDRYGHPEGDELIKALGQALHRTARRPFDMVARYGGEEFALVYFDVDQVNLQRLCLDALQNVRDLHVVHESAPLGAATASLGFALFEGGESAELLIARADAALYAAKESGRDQAVCSRPFDEMRLRGDGPSLSLSTLQAYASYGPKD
jgi:diguanylate cyclase (GGDEF)-like protein